MVLTMFFNIIQSGRESLSLTLEDMFKDAIRVFLFVVMSIYTYEL